MIWFLIFVSTNVRELWITGNNKNFTFVKDRLYLADEYGVEVLDQNLNILNRFSTPGLSQQVIYNGNKHLLILEEQRGYLYSLKDGFVDSFFISGIKEGVYGKDGWYILSVDTIFKFSLRNRLEVMFYVPRARLITLVENFLAVATDGKVCIYDLDKKVVLKEIEYKGTINLLKGVDRYLIFGGRANGLMVYMYNKDTWEEKGRIAGLFGNPFDLLIYKKRIYIAEGGKGIEVFDLKTLKRLSYLRERGVVVNGLLCKDGHLFLLTPKQVLKARIKGKELEIVKKYQNRDYVYSIGRGGVFVGIANGKDGIHVGRIDKMDTWGIIDSMPFNSLCIGFSGKYLYVGGERGLWVYQLINFPLIKFEQLSYFNHPLRNFKPKNEFVYAVSSDGMAVFWKCPCGPIKMKKFLSIQNCNDLGLVDDKIYIATDKGVFLVNVENPDLLEPLKIIEDTALTSIAVKDSLMFLGTAYGELIVYSLHTYEKLKVIDLINLKKVFKLCFKDTLLAVAGGKRGILVLDVSDVMNPKRVFYYDTPGIARDVLYWKNVLMVADKYSFLSIFLE